MALTDMKIRAMKPGDKPLYDELGLSIQYPPIGKRGKLLKRRWRFKYTFLDKGKSLSLGQYPDTGLKEARALRDEARELLRNGIDPSAQRKAKKAGGGEDGGQRFESIAREWHEIRRRKWTEEYSSAIINRLETNVFPFIGHRILTSITAPELLEVIRRLEKRGTIETANRIFSYCGQIFRYAIATGRAEHDITYKMSEALMTPQTKHFPAVTEPTEVGRLLRMIDNYNGTPVVCAALKLSPLLFQRPGEIRRARWADMDLEQAEWRFTASKRRGGQERPPHIVPLSRQAIDILEDLKPFTQNSEFVFPSARSPKTCMSENAITSAFSYMGIPKGTMTAHGFRAMARTMLDERLKEEIVHIEQQLAHAVKDPLGRAYNRTAHLDQRREMMQVWADYLDSLRSQSSTFPS